VSARFVPSSVVVCHLLSGQSCSADDDRENIDRLHASSAQHKRQLRSNQLDVRKSEQKIKDLTINIRYLQIKPYSTGIKHPSYVSTTTSIISLYIVHA